MKYWLSVLVIAVVLISLINTIVSSSQYTARFRSIRKVLSKLSGFNENDVLYGIFADAAIAVAINEQGREICLLRTGAQIPLRTGFALHESFEVFHTIVPASQIEECDIVEDGARLTGLSDSPQWQSSEGRVLDAYGAAAELTKSGNQLTPTVSQLSLRITTAKPASITHEIMLFSGISQPKSGSFYRKRFADVSRWHSRINAILRSS